MYTIVGVDRLHQCQHGVWATLVDGILEDAKDTVLGHGPMLVKWNERFKYVKRVLGLEYPDGALGAPRIGRDNQVMMMVAPLTVNGLFTVQHVKALSGAPQYCMSTCRIWYLRECVICSVCPLRAFA